MHQFMMIDDGHHGYCMPWQLAGAACYLLWSLRLIIVFQPRSQGFSLFVIGKSGKGPGTGRSHDFQHPDIVGVNKL